MRWLRRAAPAVCTLALVALGAGLPYLSALVLDGRLERETVRREDLHVSLDMARETDFFEMLALIGGEMSVVDLPEGRGMTEEEARKAAMAAREKLPGPGGVSLDPEVTPLLVTSKTAPELSGVFWNCVWDEKGEKEQLWLDDQTGRTVAFSLRMGDGAFVSKDATVAEAERYAQALEQAVDFLRAEYPVDAVMCGQVGGDEKSAVRYYRITLWVRQDGRETGYEVPLWMEEDRLYFNKW